MCVCGRGFPYRCVCQAFLMCVCVCVCVCVSGFPGGTVVKNLPASAGDANDKI